ncbi:MAG: AAA family ATPase [Bacteroidales bacterium]|jgi:exonuclease SbcC
MKILSLAFKNINSLVGENYIDFTDPIFANDGIFAITGKTGAGKSSILDAIALALYGKTPRVDVTGNDNPVMTRGEKDCYAEITFEVDGKKWKSAWKQERTRTGNLKPVSRQIADINDKIIADQVRTCDTKIVEIVGLTFEQFTKVVMLAQGSFTAFLQADKNDKGELLEQITGTEIYGEISRKVFERSKNETQKLQNIKLELEQIKVLSQEEKSNLTAEIESLQKDKQQIDIELKNTENAQKWLSDLANIENQIAETQKILPELEKKLEQVAEKHRKAENLLQKSKTESEEQTKIFVKVRELDTKIKEKQSQLNSILKAIEELEDRKKSLAEKIANDKETLSKNEKTLKEKQNWSSENAVFKELVSNFTALENEHIELSKLSDEIKKQDEQKKELKATLAEKTDVTTKATNLLKEKKDELSKKKNNFENLKSELTANLNGKQLADYQDEKENIISFGTEIKNLIDVETSLVTCENEITNYDKSINQNQILEKELSESIIRHNDNLQNLDENIKLLEENIMLLSNIQSLEEHRQKLKDGEACPLCGATEHPYAIGNVPQMGEKEKQLQQLKSEQSEITKQYQTAMQSHAKTVSDIENAKNSKQKEEKTKSENFKKKENILANILGISPDFTIVDEAETIEFLEKIRSEKQKQYKQVDELIKNAEKTEKSISTLRDKEIPELQEVVQKLEKDKNTAETDQKLTEQKLKSKEEFIADLQKQLQTKNLVFIEKIEKYDVKTIDELKNCLDLWKKNEEEIENLKGKISETTNEIVLSETKQDETEKQLKDKNSEKEKINKENDQLIKNRVEIFGEKNVDEEEKRLKETLKKVEEEKTQAEKEHNQVNTELEKSKAVLTEKEKELIEKREQKITEKSLEELQTAYAEMKLKSDEFSQKIGANKQMLTTNEENLQNHTDKLQSKDNQQLICDKWNTLNELIGSSDGKKYRNFAQALTFEHLIGLANKQLRKMSDRYILKRTGDASNPFELSVIDNFQNSEERTAQNLSGGEKFIVSLSLALGLSNMASRNMRIDTMFIDEGFGTLDNDYLDVALSALSSLQVEGKLIGVISHLTELKERIATHIEVVQKGNGHSEIRIVSG